jgi:hypothetical protein
VVCYPGQQRWRTFCGTSFLQGTRNLESRGDEASGDDKCLSGAGKGTLGWRRRVWVRSD